LSGALEKLPVKNAVLDMEAVVLDEEGKSNFQSLQAALGEGGDRASIVAYVFDLLCIDDAGLTQKPLLQRKERLQSLLESSKKSPLRYSGHVLGRAG
jgi:bifunctional non-homologous end joining protein LigD